jgi:hypothetical protein
MASEVSSGGAPLNADIAVLKSEVSGMHAAIDEIGGKMDLVLSLRVDLSVQHERLERAIDDGRKTSETVYKDIGSIHVRLDNLDTHSLNTRKKLDAWLNRGIGAVAVGSVLMGIVQFIVLEKVESLESLSEVVTRNSAELSIQGKAIATHIAATEGFSRIRARPKEPMPVDDTPRELAE